MTPPYTSYGTLAINTYWCCLATPERNVLISLSPLVVAMPPFISSSDYQLLWASTGAKSALERADALAATYYLEPGEFTPPVGDPIEGYYLYGDFWPVLFGWIVEGHAACTSLCKLLTFSNP